MTEDFTVAMSAQAYLHRAKVVRAPRRTGP
jgi:hypothetical protein